MAQSPDQFKLFRIMHLAVSGGLIVFLLTVLLLFGLQMVAPQYPQADRNFQLISIGLSLLCILYGFNRFKRKVIEAHASTAPAAERLQTYRTACVFWWAMIEGPGLVAALGLFITGNYAFVALAGVHILILLLFRPRKSNIIVLLKLTEKEVTELEGK